MKPFDPSSVVIMHGQAGRFLANNVSKRLGVRVLDAIWKDHNDGEARICIPNSIRGLRAYIIQPTNQPDRNTIELKLLVQAAQMASAESVNLVVPYMGWLRQDKPDGREPCAAAMHIKDILCAAKVNRLISFDAHSEVALYTGCSDLGVPLDHLYTAQIAVPLILEMAEFDTLASPDATGLKRVMKWHKLFNRIGLHLGTPAVCVKHRPRAGEVERVEVIGDVAGKKVLVIDDMIDTGGTHCKGADALLRAGAKSVTLFAAHPILSGDVLIKLKNSGIERVYTTNTIHHAPQKLAKAGHGRIKVLDIAPLITAAIIQIETNGSISDLFLYDKSK